ncbi:alkaline phosphatase family protein [Hazenella coriacea]|uniref:Type I phosphodiesterase/nucleotide pyrophosphatase n=1 Tax=Hazenella coriacea TaxID=1179467 RepID=A0A4R3L9Y5_9BACL|nr:alkaline phosphatase family protein [Hazenella coriacea]TCS96633.1 type I phosphodiesterase/nucleotide pyrophosphatase [Hazenella coriacea]
MGITLWLLIFVVVVIVLWLLVSPNRNIEPVPSLPPSSRKPVILIIVDSLMDQPLKEAIAMGKAPAFQFLKKHGKYIPQVVSPFPTMSVCIDSTLLTGTTPNQHHIFGLCYMHPTEKRMVNLGTGLRETIVFGSKQIVTDSLTRLNQDFLSKDVTTIHEALDQPTASINAVVYRGPFEHTLRSPRLAVLFNLLPRKIATMAPQIFSYGSLVQTSTHSQKASAFFRYGMNDRFAQMELSSIIANKQLPAFSIVYLPDNDGDIHLKGTSEIKGIIQADQELQTILHSFPSWEDAIQQATFIVMGDSGQTNLLPDKKQSYIDLRQILKPFSIMPIRQKKPSEKDQLILCLNERSAYIYVSENVSIEDVIGKCKSESKLDIIAWKEQDIIIVESGQTPGRLKFKEGGSFQDQYQQSWHLEGDLAILDLTVTENQQVEYGLYPDVLLRLSGVMDAAQRMVVVTCSPGYEMIAEASPRHIGAAHGSLHHIDSYVPMIVTGTDSQPTHPRIIDLKNWILQLVGSSNEEQQKKDE